jgi:hypothetical protein
LAVSQPTLLICGKVIHEFTLAKFVCHSPFLTSQGSGVGMMAASNWLIIKKNTSHPGSYFGFWEMGRNFGQCSWVSRMTPYFQAIGDPFVIK